MYPRLAVVDPELTRSVPPDVTASTGLDALTQLIEPFVCNKPNPMTDAICREGIRLVARSIRIVHKNGNDAGAREGMSLAALFSGMALANARLGAVHGIAGPLGGMFPAPHGVVCARLLPHVMAVNLQAIQKKQAKSQSLLRFCEIAKIIIGRKTARAEDGIEWVKNLIHEFDIPPLSRFGLTEREYPLLIEKSKRASSMKGNPVELTDKEIEEILRNEAKET
jgi:alcohol dehydrogenase class IV